ncbi:hypothetical protein F4803DRAFT_539767 [Xylaria telfairii]|nr:hypothetical protein F4803DRAFT_539767 [Xylaria telfairii]
MATSWSSKYRYYEKGQLGQASTTTNETTVEAFLQAAQTTRFDNSDAVSKFKRKFQSKLRNPADDDTNTEEALHILASKRELREYEPFIRWVCVNHPLLLQCRHDALPPLHRAIKSHNEKFLRIVLDSSTKAGTLFNPIDGNHRTCLHYAIYQRSFLAEEIIKKAKELREAATEDNLNVFITKDSINGQTPLHLAVSAKPDEGDDNASEFDLQDIAASVEFDSISISKQDGSDAVVNTDHKRVQIITEDVEIRKAHPHHADMLVSLVNTPGMRTDFHSPLPGGGAASGIKSGWGRRERSASFDSQSAKLECETTKSYRVIRIIKNLIEASDEALLVQDKKEDTPYQAIIRDLGDWWKVEKRKEDEVDNDLQTENIETCSTDSKEFSDTNFC